MIDQLPLIQNLVGPITPDQMVNIDLYPTEKMGIFVPSVGFCYYSITPDHTHPSYAIFVSLSDVCNVNIQGELVEGKPGYMNIISPGVVHHEIAGDKFSRFFAIMIDKEYFEEAQRFYTDTPLVFTKNLYKVPKGLIGELREFIIEYTSHLSSSQELLETSITRITHKILRSVYNVSTAREKFEGRQEVEKAIDFMHTNFQRKILREDIAGCTSTSPSHFSRLFKKETGYSIMDYLLNVRINKAKHILRSKDDSLTSIAYDVGFSSSAHFSNSFKQIVGQTPSDFRKRLFSVLE